MQNRIYRGKPDKYLYIMRGLPGSGKTTLANKLSSNAFSTDEYFMKDGKYEYDHDKIQQAHEWNKKRIFDAIRSGTKDIALDNTNTMAWEFRPYVEIGMKYGYSVYLVEPDSDHAWDIEKLMAKTKHKASKESMEEKMNYFEKDPSLEYILSAESPNTY